MDIICMIDFAVFCDWRKTRRKPFWLCNQALHLNIKVSIWLGNIFEKQLISLSKAISFTFALDLKRNENSIFFQWLRKLFHINTPLSDNNGIRIHNHLVRKRIFNHSFMNVFVCLLTKVFVNEVSGCGFESRCCHLNFRYDACFEQGVPWHPDKV